MDNPLLAMLKQAASGPPVSATPSVSPAREQSMSPTQLQHVSLDDLFKNMNMTPPVQLQPQQHQPQATSPGSQPISIASPQQTYGNFSGFSAMSPPGGLMSPPAHQAKLLGMLSLGKGPSSGDNSRPPSGVASASSKEEDRRNSLLNVLKSPVSAPVAVDDPVHPLPTVTSPPAVKSPALDATSPLPTSPGAGVAGSPPQASAPGLAAPPKSIFDFVSPFDAFERPSSKAPNGSEPTAPAGQSSHSAVTSPVRKALSPPAQAAPVAVATPAVATPAVAPSPSSVSPAPSSTVADLSKDLTKVRSNSPAVRQVGAVRKASFGSPPTKGKADLGLPWLFNKVVNSEGTGPVTLPPGPVTVDLSKPNVEAVVHAPGLVQVTPTTIMKAENVSFHCGRTIGATEGWLAYTLARGRIRLIDRASGARTLIQLDAAGPVIDMAVSAETLAVVASDGSVSVFAIPVSWNRDDPPCPLLFRMRPIETDLVPAENTIGDVNHLEFVNPQNFSKPSLAIGGTEGVVIVHPYDWQRSPEADAREVLTSSKVLRTSGSLAAFCLNATNQAIGLLSSSGFFSLYSSVNQNRVWHRQLPSSATLPLSSVCFIESNILVGRGNNTIFDLIQITVEIAVLSTIKLVAPAPSPLVLHFAHAAYSADKEVLIITPFARGSALAFHFALKGQPPQRHIMKDNAHVQAFDSMAEYPLDGPVLSFVLGGVDGDLDLFYSTPTGISQAIVDKAALSTEKQQTEPVKPKEKVEKKNPKKQNKPAPAAPPAAAPAAPPAAPAPSSPAAPAAAPQVTAAREVHTSASAVSPVPSATPVVSASLGPATGGIAQGGISSDELTKALKKTEDKMSSMFKQLVTSEMKSLSARLDKDKDLGATVSAAISAHLDTHLAGLVQQELQRVPIEAQIRQAVSEQAGTLGRELERAIAPIVPRTIATVVQPAVERAARDAVEVVLVPAVMSATNRMYDQLAEDLKTEMLQIRKDVDNDQTDALSATNAMLRSMSTSISELQKQVSELSDELARRRASTPVRGPRSPARQLSEHVHASHHGQHQPQSSHPQHQPQAAHSRQHPLTPPNTMPHAPGTSENVPRPPSQQQLEDTFLQVLHQSSSPAMLQLISQQAQNLDYILPVPPGRSPLPQAVLLPLVHRLTLALSDLPPHHPAFQPTATWLRRAAELLDPRDPTIASYYPRAMPIVENGLVTLLSRLQGSGPDPLVAAHVNVILQTLDIIKSKSA